MLGHFQQSLGLGGLKLQWEKGGSSATGGALAVADGPKDLYTVHPLGGAADRRRLRHVSQLAVRGLELAAADVRAGFVLELVAEGGADALERSELFRTRNPTWEPACGIRRGRQLASFELRARAEAAPEAPEPSSPSSGGAAGILWRHVVQLSALDPLNVQELEKLHESPPFGVPLVQIGKDWFTSPTPSTGSAPQAERPMRPARSTAGASKRISTTEICSTGDHISAMIGRLRELQARSESLRGAMEEPLRHGRASAGRSLRRLRSRQLVAELRREVDDRQERLRRLQSELACARERVAGAGASVAAASAAVAELRGACGAVALREAPGEAAAAGADGEVVTMQRLRSLWLRLRCRQMRMLHEACQVYPIEHTLQGKVEVWTIRGLALASIDKLLHVDPREEESVSTALGWLVHLLTTFAGILEVPLRFDVRDAGSSRTCIRDLCDSDPWVIAGKPLAAAAGRASSGARASGIRSGPSLVAAARREGPLYYGGLKKTQFETALRLLQDALEQFAYSRGTVVERLPGGNLLQRVGEILRREFFGPEVAQS